MTSIERIINRQLERWGLERKLEREGVVGEPASTSGRPWITISREYGAGGGEVARRLAADLGYRLFDREIVDVMAREAHIRAATLETLDERVRSGIELYVEGLLRGRIVERADYVRHLAETVLAIARHGHAVIVGRGAHLILEPRGGLRVRLGAPIARRVEFVQEREHLPEAAARARVEAVDHERAQFTRQAFHREIDRPEDFDLVLNTASLGLVGSVRLIERALQEKMAFGTSLAPAHTSD